MRSYVTRREVPVSNPDEVKGFPQFIESFQQHNGLGVDTIFERNEYQESSRLANRANKPTTISEPTV
jgi:hypothetical protein